MEGGTAFLGVHRRTDARTKVTMLWDHNGDLSEINDKVKDTGIQITLSFSIYFWPVFPDQCGYSKISLAPA